jgi:hypothetical protein
MGYNVNFWGTLTSGDAVLIKRHRLTAFDRAAETIEIRGLKQSFSDVIKDRPAGTTSIDVTSSSSPTRHKIWSRRTSTKR